MSVPVTGRSSRLLDAGAAVAVADVQKRLIVVGAVLEQRIGSVDAAATAASLLGVAAGRAQGDGATGRWLLAARARTSAVVRRKRHFLAEVTGHLRLPLIVGLLGEIFLQTVFCSGRMNWIYRKIRRFGSNK